MYPENIDYLHKTNTRVLKFKKENSHLFTSNENLCSFVLCDSNSMLCINQKCEDAKDFSKLTQYNAAFFSSLNAVIPVLKMVLIVLIIKSSVYNMKGL